MGWSNKKSKEKVRELDESKAKDSWPRCQGAEISDIIGAFGRRNSALVLFVLLHARFGSAINRMPGCLLFIGWPEIWQLARIWLEPTSVVAKLLGQLL